MQEIKAESLLSCNPLWNTLLSRCRSVLPPSREVAAVREGNPMTAQRSVLRPLFVLAALPLWFILGNNDVMVAQELENRSHITSESKPIPQTLASLAHDANDGSIRQIERSSTYAMPVRFIDDNINVASREEFSNGGNIGAGSYWGKDVLRESSKCYRGTFFNGLGAESKPSSMQFLAREWGLNCLTNSNIDACIRDAVLKLKPLIFDPRGVRDVYDGEAICARSFVSIPFEMVADYMSSGNEAAFIIHEEPGPHYLFDADFALFVGPRSARNWKDGFFYFLNGINKPVNLGLSASEKEQAEKANEAAYPHTGAIVVHSPISDNCHLSDLGDSITLTCDDLTIPK
jgi:hypothetical protein